jgi:hypothetical protein
MLEGGVPDPMWTNPTPLTRFDGLLVRRRGYQHVKMFPMYQDKYLFEVLALRNNVFIRSAALQATTPHWNQKVAACNVTPHCAVLRRCAAIRC